MEKQHCQRQTAIRQFAKLYDTIAQLRDPVRGCPWDLKQTHRSLRKYMIEEAYEAIAHMSKPRPSLKLAEELGDVLLQILLNAQIASDNSLFSIVDVMKMLDAKMKRRHPHVFSKLSKPGLTASEVRKAWSQIKEKEESLDGRKKRKQNLFTKLSKEAYPALIKAQKIGEKCAEIDFDWEKTSDVWSHFLSEVSEADEALKKSGIRSKDFLNELGDVFFTLAQTCRHAKLNPELVAESGNQKFIQRFSLMEQIANSQNTTIKLVSRETKESLWREAKKRQTPHLYKRSRQKT